MIKPAENMGTKCNERPPQSQVNKTVDTQELPSKCKSKRFHHDEIWKDQQKTRQTLLSLGHYDNNQGETFASSYTNILLLVGHTHINQADIFTSAY